MRGPVLCCCSLEVIIKWSIQPVVFPWNGLADWEIQFSEIVGVQRPAHGQDDFMVLEKIGQLAAGGPQLSDVGFQLNQFFRTAASCSSVRCRVARDPVYRNENLRAHVNGRKIIPDGDFSLVFRVPENRPGIRRLANAVVS